MSAIVRLRFGPAAAIAVIALIFWASPLSFIPVPWPDDSAFFLPGIDWIQWPPHYRMHAQAPYVPSYDVANFNTMPLLPLLLGVANQLGISSSHGIRIFGVAALAAWAALLAAWLRRRGAPAAWIWLIGLGAVFSPAARWGAMVVRPEIWQGLLWTLMLMELDGFFRKTSSWRLPVLLALAAGIHFEAIVWVPAVAVALLARAGARPARLAREAWSLSWRTLVLLGPWLLYVVLNWGIFWEQMHVQFGRLDAHHTWLDSAYGWFHNLFLSLGSAASYPKFFTVGKALTWLALVGGVVLHLVRARTSRETRPARLAAVAAVLATLYLWSTKPELWFTVLIHASLWPLLALAVARADWARVPRPARVGALAAASLLLVLEAATAADQYRRIRHAFSWDRYNEWVSCVDSAIGERTRIWQPHWPDLLVELAGRKPHRDYTRAVDFPGVEPLVERHARSSEAILHTALLPLSEPESGWKHEGPARDFDRNYLTNDPWLPFRKYSALQLGAPWELKICHNGPFWAAITLAPPGKPAGS